MLDPPPPNFLMFLQFARSWLFCCGVRVWSRGNSGTDGKFTVSLPFTGARRSPSEARRNCAFPRSLTCWETVAGTTLATTLAKRSLAQKYQKTSRLSLAFRPSRSPFSAHQIPLHQLDDRGCMTQEAAPARAVINMPQRKAETAK